MKVARVTLKSLVGSPYSPSRAHFTPKLNKESSDDYENRTWREKAHTTPDGYICIPPTAFKNCLSEAAKYMGRQIPGKGKNTYTKHFEAGVLVLQGLKLPVKKDDAEGETLFLNADGRRGGSKRVNKRFPVIRSWEGVVEFLVLDNVITKEAFVEHLAEAGNFIGIGRFRPRNNGFYGRFDLVKVEWSEK